MTNGRRATFWAWLWGLVGLLYFFVPLYGTLDFSLRAKRGEISLLAYQNVFGDPQFLASFAYSARMALLTILISILLVVPTAYWLHLKLPKLRPVVELITLLPFIIPVIVYVFGLIRTFSRPPFLLTQTEWTTDLLLASAYVVISLPYMYRAVDTGLNTLDVHTLTEAAQSLGASWPAIILRVIVPNLRVAILSGALLTFATVIGELILADFLVRPALGPYMVLMGQSRAYEPAALGLLSFALTWISMGLIQFFSRGGAALHPSGR